MAETVERAGDGPPPQRFFKTGDGLIVRLYLYGDDLDPDGISVMLGVRSDRARHKGPWQGPSGETYQQRTGFWSIGSGVESDDLSDHLHAIRGRLPDPDMYLPSIPGVTSALLDVLVQAPNYGPDSSPTVGFHLEPDDLSALHRLGIAFELTCYLPVGEGD